LELFLKRDEFFNFNHRIGFDIILSHLFDIWRIFIYWIRLRIAPGDDLFNLRCNNIEIKIKIRLYMRWFNLLSVMCLIMDIWKKKMIQSHLTSIKSDLFLPQIIPVFFWPLSTCCSYVTNKLLSKQSWKKLRESLTFEEFY